MALKVGDNAPNFTLPDADKVPRSLADFLGKKTVIAFYPGAFTGVCTKEMCTLRDSLTNLTGLNAQVMGISVDSPFANKGFANANHISFPLLSDYSRKTSEQYCGLTQNFAGLEGLTVAKRSVFILDKSGVVRYAWISENPGVEPPYDDITKALGTFS